MRFVWPAAVVLGLVGVGIGCGGEEGGTEPEAGSSTATGSSGSGESSSSSGGGSSSSGGWSSSGSGGASSGGSGSSSSSGAPAATPWLVQCFYGAAIAGFDASNPDIEAACASLSQTTVKTCAGGGDCPIGFSYTSANAAYSALFEALDTNDDDAVDAADTVFDVALIGHSWGGTNVADIGKRLFEDNRVAAARKGVKLAVVWDPYRPGYELRPSSNFERFLVLRQSGSPSGDCSESVPLVGPFKGLAPRCTAGQGCEDYDYSGSPTIDFPAFPSGTIKGNRVGHCDVPNVGFPVAKAILDGTPLPPLPQSIPVAAP